MIKYTKLKAKIINEVAGVDKKDFCLIEGKLIFKQNDKCAQVKQWLERNYRVKVVQQKATNYKHWNSKYEAELYFQDLPKGTEA